MIALSYGAPAPAGVLCLGGGAVMEVDRWGSRREAPSFWRNIWTSTFILHKSNHAILRTVLAYMKGVKLAKRCQLTVVGKGLPWVGDVCK